jgi:hypothetical protein
MISLSQPIHCRIQFSGFLEQCILEDSSTLEFSYAEDECQHVTTTLEGSLSDYAALYGILNFLYGLGMPLLSVQVLAGAPLEDG